MNRITSTCKYLQVFLVSLVLLLAFMYGVGKDFKYLESTNRLGSALKDSTIPRDNEKKIEVGVEENSITDPILLDVIEQSNYTLSFTGKMGKKSPIWMFLSITVKENIQTIDGIYSIGRNTGSLDLIGEIVEDAIVIHEIFKNPSGEIVKTNNTISLTQQSGNKWKGVSQKKVMDLVTYAPSQSNFIYQGQPIHPRIISLLLEKIKGSYLPVSLRHQNQRKFQKKDGWYKANMEYGFIRYRILGNKDNLWLLHVESNNDVNQNPMTQLLQIVRIQDNLALYRIVDENAPPQNIIQSVKSNNQIVYEKKINGQGFWKIVKQFYPDRINSSEISSMDLNKNHDPCRKCSYGIARFKFDIAKNQNSIEQLLLEGNQNSSPIPDSQIKFSLEQSFVKMVNQYLAMGKSKLNFHEIGEAVQSFIDIK